MNTIIEPTILTEAKNYETVADALEYFGCTTNVLPTILDNYFSSDERNQFIEYLKNELDILDDEFLDESVDTDVDSLIDKIKGSELKDLIKSSGMSLRGNESDDELKGMAKVLAAKNESLKESLSAIHKYEEEQDKSSMVADFIKMQNKINAAKTSNELQDCLREFENAGFEDSMTKTLHIMWDEANRFIQSASSPSEKSESKHSKFLK